MEDNFDPIDYKNKFASLIALLHKVGITDDCISFKISTDEYFSLFEKNDHLKFTKISNEEILKDVFGKEDFLFDYEAPLTSEYVWSGLMYFTLLYEYHVPLERLFLIYPISAMIDKYHPYHEMPSNALYEQYLRDENEISIIKRLKKLRRLTSKQLSVLTGINERTINSYNDNKKLFSASYANISLLAKAFKVKISTFKKKSDFVLLTDYSFNDEQFANNLKSKLIEFFNVNNDIYFVDSFKTKDELIQIGKEFGQFIYLPDYALIKYRNKLQYTFIQDYELNMLISRC